MFGDAIGPRIVGGTYRSHHWQDTYTVTAITVDPSHFAGWQMTVQWSDGHETTHCTAWDTRDTVEALPADASFYVMAHTAGRIGTRSERYSTMGLVGGSDVVTWYGVPANVATARRGAVKFQPAQ